MPTTIKLKNSVTTTNAPSSLVQGEVAINITDKKVWVGNAASTPIQLLGDGGSASFTSIAFGAGTVSNPSITFTGDTNTGIYSPAADTIAFTEGGVEAMRIDSTGSIGIGITAPSVILDVNVSNPTRGIINRIRNNAASSFTGAQLLFTQNTIADWSIGQPASTNAFAFWSARNSASDGAEVMRIDSSGNVGIGTQTPDARLQVQANNSTNGIILRVRNSSTSSFTGAQVLFTQNTIQDWTIGQPAGVDAFAFWSARNSTDAGIERLRIDSSGNVGIGTSSPSTFNPNTSTNKNLTVLIGDQATTLRSYWESGVDQFSLLRATNSSNTITNMRYEANNHLFLSGTGASGTERMRIDSAGNVGIGVTPFVNTISKGLDITGGAGLFGFSNGFYLTGNLYYDGAWKYKTSNPGGVFYFDSAGQMQGAIAASGTANATASIASVMSVGRGTTFALQGGVGTSGTGIAFPPTQNASSDANTLDDYEEGTWTPTSGTTNVSLSLNGNAIYTKVGRQVTAYFYATVTNSTGANINGFRVNGLPFVGTGYGFAGSYYNPNISGVAYGGYVESAQNYIMSGLTLVPAGNAVMILAVYFV